jgi:multidrug efflux pump subunit AcrB
VAYNTTGTIGPSDGEILVTLKEGHSPTADYIAKLRQELPRRFPQCTFFFSPADITTQILNFGLPAPIDVQVVGRDKMNYDLARKVAAKMSGIPGIADVNIHQIVDVPQMTVNVDRERASEMGLTQKDVATDILVSLSSSAQSAPNFWLDPKNGVSYLVAVQTPQRDVSDMMQLNDTPLYAGGKNPFELLGNLSNVKRSVTTGVINHYNIAPVFDIYANVQGRDLGGVSSDVQKVLDSFHGQLPKGTTLEMHGQVESMNAAFIGLGGGLVFSVFLVYLLMVINFQSLIDPLIIVCALPGALSGILWMLFVTQTTFSVPALMGAILCIGVSTANSILIVSFANDRRAAGDSARTAAMAAGVTRLRPVLMTAAAMILGMLPMALAFGEGGEQNAPLGRAVIGGLFFATVTTLFFVPVIYSLLRKKAPTAEPSGDALTHTAI